MADYYSLLSRAIANLPKSSPPTARRAIYDRARKALNNQLRSLKPPLPESDIAREENALDAAVQRLEAEIDPALAGAAPPPQPPAPPPRAAAPPPAPPRPVAPASVAAEPRPTLRAPTAVAPRPSAAPAAATLPPASMAPPLSAKAPTARADDRNAAPSVVEPPAAPGVAAPPIAAPLSREMPVDDGAPLLKPTAPLGPPRDSDSARPVAPRPDDEGGSGLWKWAILAVVVGLVGAVALGAYLLRSQRPQDLAIKETKVVVPTPTESPTPAAGPKINERVGGVAAPAQTPEAAPDASTAPTQAATPAATPTTAASPNAPATPAPAMTPSQTATFGADRAAMLLATPQDVQKPTVFVGGVTWSSPPPAPGQGGGPGVRADIDIPDLKMHATMLMRKNVDPGLPASHTIDLRLTFDDGSQFKGLKDVGVPQMRRDEPATVTPLLGVRVVINDSYFLIGLNRADTDQQHNMDAIGLSGWFDFPMLLPDGRIGKLTFEKGADGEKLVNAALAAWK